MKKIISGMLCLIVTACFVNVQAEVPKRVSKGVAQKHGCLSCHQGIEDIREEGSAMLAQIKGIGAYQGDPGGCVVCHGGNPQGQDAEEAHQGVPENERVRHAENYRRMLIALRDGRVDLDRARRGELLNQDLNAIINEG